MNRKKKSYMIVSLILAVVFLSACNNSGNTATPQTTEPQQASAPTEAQETNPTTQSMPETQTTGEISTEAPATDASAEAQANTTPNAASDGITEEDAKKIAFSDAGVQESDVTGIRVKKEIDDGIEEYEVDFYVGTTEYDYDIDATTGAIRSKDMDIDNDFGGQSADGTTISEADVKAIILEQLPQAKESDIRMELDWEDGRRVYEGSVYPNGGPEYEFEIDASTGKILSWEED